MQNIDIIDILDDLDSFSKSKVERKLLKVTLTQNSKLKNLSQEELLNLFSNNLHPYIEESILAADKERKEHAKNKNTPEALQASMSYDFINDVMVYSQYYLSHLDFAYFLKTGRHIFITGDNDSKFIAPLSMFFHIRNLLAFTSLKGVNQLYLDLQNSYQTLLEAGYCTSDENDPNLPALQISIIHVDTTFSIECTNNFLSINAPNELKQELYFNLLSNFIQNILKELTFDFVNIGKDKGKDFINIYPALMDSKRLFLAHMTTQLRNNYL